jgi:hypothetical protein
VGARAQAPTLSSAANAARRARTGDIVPTSEV